MKYSNKKIVITGASTGFGNITARLLAQHGHQVFATMRNIESQNNLLNESFFLLKTIQHYDHY